MNLYNAYILIHDRGDSRHVSETVDYYEALLKFNEERNKLEKGDVLEWLHDVEKEDGVFVQTRLEVVNG